MPTPVRLPLTLGAADRLSSNSANLSEAAARSGQSLGRSFRASISAWTAAVTALPDQNVRMDVCTARSRLIRIPSKLDCACVNSELAGLMDYFIPDVYFYPNRI